MTNKLTNKEVLNAVLNMAEVKANPAYEEKIKAMLEALEKKSANRKPTSQQIENENIKVEILEILEGYPNGLKVGQIMKLASYEFKSNQQCTALLRQLRLENKVARVETKEGTLYSLAEEEA